MTQGERELFKSFIISREEVAYSRLKEDKEYLQCLQQQEESNEIAEALLHKLEKSERITIRRHYEGEVVKEGFEQDEVYIQGLRDGTKLLALLGVIQMDIQV